MIQWNSISVDILVSDGCYTTRDSLTLAIKSVCICGDNVEVVNSKITNRLGASSTPNTIYLHLHTQSVRRVMWGE